MWLGDTVGVFLYHAHAWGVEWIDEIFLVPTMFCMWFYYYKQIVANISLLLVHLPLACLHEWCVQWVVKLANWDIKCGGAWMGT